MIKNKKLMLLCSLFVLSGIHADSDQEIFLEGNKLYYDDQYEQAVEKYETIDNKGSAVWYNIGNAEYRLGKKAEAQAAWYRSMSNAPDHIIKSAHANIQVAKQDLGLAQKASFIEYINYRLLFISLLLFQIIFLVGWFLFFILLFVRVPYKIILLIFLMAANGLILTAICLKYRTIYQRKAVVVTKVAQLYAGPDVDFHLLGSVPYGQIVIITKEDKDWHKVYQQGTLGWLTSESIHLI